jgi:hypothetical protein
MVCQAKWCFELALQLISYEIVLRGMGKFLLWCVLLVLCWPLALLALVLYPIVWVLVLPFRIVGIAVGGVLGLLRGIFMLPARVLSGPRAL